MAGGGVFGSEGEGAVEVVLGFGFPAGAAVGEGAVVPGFGEGRVQGEGALVVGHCGGVIALEGVGEAAVAVDGGGVGVGGLACQGGGEVGDGAGVVGARQVVEAALAQGEPVLGGAGDCPVVFVEFVAEA